MLKDPSIFRISPSELSGALTSIPALIWEVSIIFNNPKCDVGCCKFVSSSDIFTGNPNDSEIVDDQSDFVAMIVDEHSSFEKA